MQDITDLKRKVVRMAIGLKRKVVSMVIGLKMKGYRILLT